MSDELILVRPSEPRTASIARLSFDGDDVRLYFPEPRTKLNDIVKAYGYRWQRPYWTRTIAQERHADRAAELAQALLAAGYCVKGPRSIMETAVAGSFQAEPVRIVGVCTDEGEHEGWFSIWWHRERGGELRRPAKRIPGTRWQNGYVVAPPEQFAAVLDFAEMYECHVTAAAQRMAEAARAEEEAAIVVDVAALETAVDLPQPNGRPPKLDVPETIEVDKELLDV